MASPTFTFTSVYALTFILLSVRWAELTAFQMPIGHGNKRSTTPSAVSFSSEEKIDSMFGPRVDDGEDVVLYSDGADSDDDWGAPSAAGSDTVKTKSSVSRWDSLNPKIKARIVKEGQEKAIRNKKRREPAEEKKRREFTKVKTRFHLRILH